MQMHVDDGERLLCECRIRYCQHQYGRLDPHLATSYYGSFAGKRPNGCN